MVASNLTLQGVLDMTGNVITNLGLPTTAGMAATKGYVDAATTTKVTGVSAAAPLSSSGGATPEISLAGQISGANITNNAISTENVADGAITSNKLDASVDARYINASGDTMTGILTVNTTLIANGTITAR